MIKGMRHTGLVVHSLEPAIDFWTNIMGFHIVKQMEEHGKHIDLMMGLDNVIVTTVKLKDDQNGMIELLYFHNHTNIPRWQGTPFSTGLTHIAFTVCNIEEIYKKFTLMGRDFPAPPQLSPDGAVKVIYVSGPEGLLMELVEELD